MIPSSTCSTSDSTENVPTNSLATQWGDKKEKQVIVNNYYVKEQTGGWEASETERDLAKYFKNLYTDQNQ